MGLWRIRGMATTIRAADDMVSTLGCAERKECVGITGMTQAVKAQEPSMEEILASIRRIIADDDASKPAKASEDPLRPASLAEVAAVSWPSLGAVCAATETCTPPPPAAPKSAASSAAPAKKTTEQPERKSTPCLQNSTHCRKSMAKNGCEPTAYVLQRSDLKNDRVNDVGSTRNAAAGTGAKFPRHPAWDIRRRVHHQAWAVTSDRALDGGNETIAAVDSAFTGGLAHTVIWQNARTLEDGGGNVAADVKSWLDSKICRVWWNA